MITNRRVNTIWKNAFLSLIVFIVCCCFSPIPFSLRRFRVVGEHVDFVGRLHVIVNTAHANIPYPMNVAMDVEIWLCMTGVMCSILYTFRNHQIDRAAVAYTCTHTHLHTPHTLADRSGDTGARLSCRTHSVTPQQIIADCWDWFQLDTVYRSDNTHNSISHLFILILFVYCYYSFHTYFDVYTILPKTNHFDSGLIWK